jgi:hypothetical protein
MICAIQYTKKYIKLNQHLNFKRLKQKLKITFSNILLTVCFLVLFAGCYKKDFNQLKLANATPEYLYPLIDAELSLKDIIDPNKRQLNITEDADGFYTFIYYQDLFEQYITDLLKIADIVVNQTVSLTATEVNTLRNAGTVSHTFTNSFTLNTSNGEQLKHIVVKSGSIPFNISSTFKHNIQLTVTFPYITQNGIPLSQTIAVNYTGTSPVISNSTIDLSGYTIDCSQNGTKVNTLSYSALLKVNFIAGNTASTTQKIDITTGISGITYSYADGYIGQYSLSVPQDSVAIDIFDNAYAGNIYFTDPQVRAIIDNSIGAASSVKINQLVTQSQITGTTPITGSLINTNIPINYPSTSQVGQAESTTIQLDKTNSNVQTVFNPAPNKVIYQMSAILNPSGVSTNFVTDSSKIKIRGEVEIPMEGKVTKFVLLDTIKGISYPDITISGKQVTITKAGFNIALSNGFPMNSNIQMYFLDDANNIIDSLFSGPHFITSAPVDATGKVTQSTDVFIQEMFDEARYKRVTTSTKAVLYAFFSTVNNGTVPVKIYSSYKIKSNISIDVKANVSF